MNPARVQPLEETEEGRPLGQGSGTGPARSWGTCGVQGQGSLRLHTLPVPAGLVHRQDSRALGSVSRHKSGEAKALGPVGTSKFRFPEAFPEPRGGREFLFWLVAVGHRLVEFLWAPRPGQPFPCPPVLSTVPQEN